MKNSFKPILAKVRPFIKSLKPIVKRHYFVALMLILGFLIYSVFAVNATLTKPTDEQYVNEKRTSGTTTTFDQKTIDKIRLLRKSGETPDTLLPGGRINPFTE